MYTLASTSLHQEQSHLQQQDTHETLPAHLQIHHAYNAFLIILESVLLEKRDDVRKNKMYTVNKSRGNVFPVDFLHKSGERTHASNRFLANVFNKLQLWFVSGH